MKSDWHKKALLAAISLSLVGMPVLAAPPEGKGNNGNHGQDDGYGKTVILSGQQHGKSHGKPEHGQRHDKQSKHSTGEQRYQRGGISVTDARRFAYESHLDYRDYRALPPGIRMNLARGKPLPPGIAKRQVPHDLLVRLPQHPGYEWQVVGTDLLLVTVGTLIVHEILKDVFLH
ncbi:anti-virulence regulator CigR family protein [Vogesella sp. GCM10023246]|uniref:Anti-virulence regulator CigR family protein n=1 Tax=Vogesella oryzagri TaxID=3160864 RepID=A0ABV1M8K9_9NEIS